VVVSARKTSNVALNASVPGGAVTPGWNIMPFQKRAFSVPAVPKMGSQALGAEPE
jgi:hypothetical protein